jgi:hypothetical protein
VIARLQSRIRERFLASKKKIRQIEHGKKKADLCREFGLVNSKIQKIWGKEKRFRKPERSDYNGARVKRFKQERSGTVQ